MGKCCSKVSIREEQLNTVDLSLESGNFEEILREDINNEKLLIPGVYVEIRFLYPETGILADKNWITLTPTGAEVFLLKNGVIEKRQVQIGAPIGNQYWIKSGLSEGESIITVPVSSAQIGQPAEGAPQ